MVEELEPGAYVTPSVRLLRPLAQGGMGTVWVAEHLTLDMNVVVKLMARQFDGVPEAAGRFAREAAVAAAVKSPHVVQVFDSGVTEGGVAFIVMELLEGHDLGAHLAARGRMAPQEVLPILTQLGKALSKAHRVGVIHRDIKPDNVFLCDGEGGEPFVKLLDFGTAKHDAGSMTQTTAGQLIGTPFYMSPEQILGEEIDARTDIWSLGVVAFEALTGTRPFEGATVGAITLAIHTTQPRMTDVVPELPRTLDDWFARACARDPAARFETVRAAAHAFVHAVTGEVPLAESSPASRVDLAHSFPLPPRGATGAHGMTSSAATSLSSTLAAPRTERRTMTWLAVMVGLGALAAMIALITTDGDRHPAAANMAEPSASAVVPSAALAPSAAPAQEASAVAAASPPPSPTPTAVTPSPAASSLAAASPPAAVSPVPAPAPAPISTLAKVPVTNGPAVKAEAQPRPSAPPPRASAPALPPAPALPSAPPLPPATSTAPVLPPAPAASSSAPLAPSPYAAPSETAPEPPPPARLDLDELLPPTTPAP